jgi:hypothetical protein
MSIDEFAITTPVRPSIVDRNTNPSAHRQFLNVIHPHVLMDTK